MFFEENIGYSMRNDPWDFRDDGNDQQDNQSQTLKDPNQESLTDSNQSDTSEQNKKVLIPNIVSFDESLSTVERRDSSGTIITKDVQGTETISNNNSTAELPQDHSSDHENVEMMDDDKNQKKNNLEKEQLRSPIKPMRQVRMGKSAVEIPSSITKSSRQLLSEEISKRQALHLSDQLEMQASRYHTLNKTGKVIQTENIFTRVPSRKELKKSLSQSRKRERKTIIGKLSNRLGSLRRIRVKNTPTTELPELV